MKKCQFTKEEFYSNKKNKKIDLLCELNEKGIFKKTYYRYDDFVLNVDMDIEKILIEIFNDLDGKIPIKQLEEFLLNEEKQIIKRLGLIRIIICELDPERLFVKLKNINERIKNDIKELSSIKNSLSTFYKNKYQFEIGVITNFIKDIQENDLNYYKSEETQEKIKKLKDLRYITYNVEKVDFLLFKVLYDEAYGNDREERFNEALKQLDNIKYLFYRNATAKEIYQENKEIFNKIKEMISNNESKLEIFIKQMIDYFNIAEKKELINDFTLIFKSNSKK